MVKLLNLVMELPVGILKTIGKVIIVIGLVASAFGGFLCGFSLLSP